MCHPFENMYLYPERKKKERKACSIAECCITPTETVRIIRDGEPRTATSTFTQLLNSKRKASSPFVVLYVHRNSKAC